jgi:excisionase family DNA binding protein
MPHDGRAVLITTSPAARILKTSEGTVRQLVRRGELRCIKTENGMRLLELDDVQRLAAKRQALRDARREAK